MVRVSTTTFLVFKMKKCQAKQPGYMDYSFTWKNMDAEKTKEVQEN